MAYFGNQLKQILRRLPRTPGFTAITLLTLAISIGANTAIFSVVDGVLLKPLPYPHPEQLVALWHNPLGLKGPEWCMAPSSGVNTLIFQEYRGSKTQDPPRRQKRRTKVSAPHEPSRA